MNLFLVARTRFELVSPP